MCAICRQTNVVQWMYSVNKVARIHVCCYIAHSTVVLHIGSGIMKVWRFWPHIITQKPAWYLLSDREYWLGIATPKNVFRSILNPSIKKLRIFKNLMQFSTNWLTLLTYVYLLMPSDKHNLRTARARDFISSLINAASSRDVPFHQPQPLKCLHHGATIELLCVPFFLYNRV